MLIVDGRLPVGARRSEQALADTLHVLHGGHRRLHAAPRGRYLNARRGARSTLPYHRHRPAIHAAPRP
jgi:hypothetical protein